MKIVIFSLVGFCTLLNGMSQQPPVCPRHYNLDGQNGCTYLVDMNYWGCMIPNQPKPAQNPPLMQGILLAIHNEINQPAKHPTQ